MDGRPQATTGQVRKRMQSQARRDTSIELQLRRELWRRGLRYRVDYPLVVRRRRHDVVFTRAKVVVDVRGCFWHGCPEHGTLPKSNSRWWQDKLEANRRRDVDTVNRLRDAGWEVVVVWEHDDISAAADRIEREVRGRSCQ